MLSDKEKGRIKAEAQELLKKFGKALEDVEQIEDKPSRGESFRDESAGLEAEPDFRERMFDNAPKSKGDFIVTEKKKW